MLGDILFFLNDTVTPHKEERGYITYYIRSFFRLHLLNLQGPLVTRVSEKAAKLDQKISDKLNMTKYKPNTCCVFHKQVKIISQQS